MENVTKQLDALLRKYYLELYRGQLGLSDYEERIAKRLNEETEIAWPNIERIQSFVNYQFDRTKKVLIVGGGTGAEFVALSKKGCEVYVIEPNTAAIEIMELKCDLHGLDKNRVTRGVAEELQYGDDCFDFVYCFTVIEHVQDVERSIKEMIRVTKKGGLIYINTPDYRQLYEAHYKMNIPMFLPKWIIKAILLVRRRPVDFFDTLKFVNAKQLKTIFKNNNLVSLRVYLPYTKYKNGLSVWGMFKTWMQDNLEIETNQFWILIKQ